LLCFGLLLSSISIVFADGTEGIDEPTIPLAKGTGTVAAGVGLSDVGLGIINIDVPVNAVAKQVLLYWAGENIRADDFGTGNTILVNGVRLEGQFIGGDTLFSGTDLAGERSISYRLDITEYNLIVPGSNALQVGGLGFTDNNDGAGLLVIYDDGGQDANIQVRDGNDFAFDLRDNNDLLPRERISKINEMFNQTYLFEPSAVPRIATVNLFVVSVADETEDLGFRPSSLEFTIGGDDRTQIFPDLLDNHDGNYWDTLKLVFEVPAGANNLAVEPFSRNDRVVAPGNVPAALFWVAASVSVEAPDPDSCWFVVSGKTEKTSESKGSNINGDADSTSGSWQVIDHDAGLKFKSKAITLLDCNEDRQTQVANEAFFEGSGSMSGVSGFSIKGLVRDSDSYVEYVITDSNGETVMAFKGMLDKGKVQVNAATN